MIDITTIDSNELNGTRRLIVEEIKQRGWRAETPYQNSPHLFIDRGDGRKIHIFSASPPANSFAAAHLANDKYATSEVLKSAGIAQLASLLVKDDHDIANKFLADFKTLVVKPADAGHGNGITTNITTLSQLNEAIDYAVGFAKNGRAILQEQFIADKLSDIRVSVIDGKAAAAIMRVPARVFGDGVTSVGDLIIRENQSPERGKPYRAKLAFINVERARAFLGEAVDRIPLEGEEVTVLGVANYGAGGELVDVTDDVPAWMMREAEVASRVLGLAVSGVDYMVKGLVSPDLSHDLDHAVIIEINKCPALAIHDEPTVGISRGVCRTYVDYLATL